MKLLILDGSVSPKDRLNPTYRGTYRAHPLYDDSRTDEHEINQMFRWFIEEGGELGVVHDPRMALTYAELCNKHFPSKHFEVIEVVLGKGGSSAGGKFLGFDLSQGYNNSLIFGGLKTKYPPNTHDPVDVLWRVVSSFFAPQLNKYGLFSDFDTASFCLDSMIALQSLKDNMFEGDDLAKFKVVGIYLLSVRI